MQKNIVQQIKRTDWKKWGSRRSTIRIIENWTKCTVLFKKFFHVDFPDQLFLVKNEVGYGYFNRRQFNNCLKELLKNIYKLSFYNFYERNAKETFKKFLNYCKTLSRRPLRKYSSNKLIKISKEFLENEDRFTNFLWVIFILDEYLSSQLEISLKRHLKANGQADKVNELLKIIVSPEKKSAVFNQKLDILKLVRDIRDKKIKTSGIGKRLKLLEKKYAFFNILNFDEKTVDSKEFKKDVYKIVNNKQINPGKEIERINKQYKDAAKNFKKVAESLKKNIKLSILAEACHQSSYYRDYRNDIRRLSYSYAKELYIEIARRLGLTLTDLLYLTRDEIIAALNKNRISVDSEKRKKLSAVAFINNKIYYIFEHNEVLDLFNCLEPAINAGEVKGVSANPGKVQGVAKIILDVKNESLNFSEGDILITSMTNLDFVPLMSKALAIITDEGGLLCHTAIVAREMKKPCVVGTKIATKVLKDGDLIEVDANNGIVKIIKRAK